MKEEDIKKSNTPNNNSSLLNNKNEIFDFMFDDLGKIYKALEKTSDDYIFLGDIKKVKFKYPKEFIERFGFESEIIDNPYIFWKKIIFKDDWNKFYQSTKKLLRGETDTQDIEFRAKDISGKYVWLGRKGTVIKNEDGEPMTFVGVISFLNKKNRIDNLTGLMKITEFYKRITEKINKFQDKTFSIMVFGVDNFKQMNRTYSYEYGDKTLKRLASIIQYTLPDNIELYRLNGDNFGIIIENSEKEYLKVLYSEIKENIVKVQLQLPKKERINLTISAGCATYPKDGITYQELYKHVDYALLFSKKTGKNKITFFSNRVANREVRQFGLMYFLKESISNNFEGFKLVYQPQICSATHKIKGVEALLRWSCKRFGNVSPMEFIPILEEDVNLMTQVGKWVLLQVIKDFKELTKIYPDFVISINISCVQLLDEISVEELDDIIVKNNFPKKNICFEITESNTIVDINLGRNIYKKIKEAGIKIALDDFGTGYSSLGILKEFPVDLVKVDRSFVKNILNSTFDATFIKLISELCHSVGVKVCVEGIEDEKELKLVKNMNVDYIQGYYFGKPQSKEEIIENYLEKQ